MELGKIPPNDVEAEQAVIGSMLTDRDAVISAIEVLKEEDFYREDNKTIYEAILNLYNRSEPIDIITLKAELTSMGMFDKIELLQSTHQLYTQYHTLDGLADFYYSWLTPSTGYLQGFDLVKYNGGLLLVPPMPGEPEKPASIEPQEKMLHAFKEYLTGCDRPLILKAHQGKCSHTLTATGFSYYAKTLSRIKMQTQVFYYIPVILVCKYI